ncbi:hypothetical protein NicSoilB11_41740 (plasmid) [Arthrobacter sp. NicSoilB11]|nr:hypothetical protein NicSoilB11_41740 [Arthrobacter sp. NicSoilB11]
MSGRQSLAGAFAPVTTTRGAALQGLLAPKRGRGAPAAEPGPEEPTEAAAEGLIQAPPAETRDPAETRLPAGEPPMDNPPTEKERTRETPHDLAGKREEPKTASAKTSKDDDEQRPVSKKAANSTRASQLVSGALRNVGVYLPPELLAQVKDAVYQKRTTYADLLIDAFEAVDDKQIAKGFTTETVLTKSGMPRRAPRKRGEAGIQIQLRLDGLQVAWLDEKVTEFDAPSRSALVSSVFKLYIQDSLA